MRKILTVSPFGPAGPGLPAGPMRPFNTDNQNMLLELKKQINKIV